MNSLLAVIPFDIVVVAVHKMDHLSVIGLYMDHKIVVDIVVYTLHYLNMVLAFDLVVAAMVAVMVSIRVPLDSI